MTPTLPKVDTAFPGAGCLLCYAAASMANSSLTTHTQTLTADELAAVTNDLATLLRKKGMEVSALDAKTSFKELPDTAGTPLNFSKKDFSSFQKKYNIDKLLVISIDAVGIERTYSSYFPTGAPQGVVRGVGYLVNLKDNSLEWYLPITQARSATGEWDEAPKFAGLTNAYYQAIEGARDDILKPFKQ
jgi:hypothetical protein